MTKKIFTLTMLCLSLVANSSRAAVIIDEDFESYADTAAMAAVWTPLTAGGTLSTTVGNPGNSASHVDAGVNQRSFGVINPTATESLVLTGQIFDDAASANKRRTIGLRSDTPANLIEMGMFNSPSHYAVRVALFGAGNPNGWFAFNIAGGNIPVAGWHTFQATITDTTVDFSLDLLSDGSIDGTLNFVTSALPAGFNNLRFGGPSGNSSAGGGANFDNIRLETVAVPEPSSFGLCALVGCVFFRRRSR